MNLLDLTPQQLKRAASIKEQIEVLNKELFSILGEPAESKRSITHRRTLSATARKNIAAAQKARWAKTRGVRRGKPPTKSTARKKTMSSAARARVSAKLKAYWAARKAGKK